MHQGATPPGLSAGTAANSPIEFWSLFAGAFSTDECTQLTDAFIDLNAQDGGLVAGKFEQTIRQSSLAWLPDSVEFEWVDRRMARIAADANRILFGFDLDGFDEQLQMASYGTGHYYDWHIDRGQGTAARRRKLTLSVQLTNPTLYEGGTLEINADGHPFQAPRDQGTAVVFAATTLHRVAPITEGLRFSLVAWTHGPAFV